MKRYAHLRRLAPLGGLVAAAVVAFSAAPAGATVVCTPGHTPPTPPATSPYCTNVKPTGTTQQETNVTATSATLNGLAGSTVPGGDPTAYHFEYGTTLAYGTDTPTVTLGACPAGVTPQSPYCTTPGSQAVSASISDLTPCTMYDDRIVSTNPDGTADGANSSFTTPFAKPISKVKVPKKVKVSHHFTVKVTLKFAAKIRIVITRGHRVVKVVRTGMHPSGTFKRKIKAPKKAGKYHIKFIGRESCGHQTVTKSFKVVKHGHHHHKH